MKPLRTEVMLNMMVVLQGGGHHVCMQLGPFTNEEQATDVMMRVNDKMRELASEFGAVAEPGQWYMRDGKWVQ